MAVPVWISIVLVTLPLIQGSAGSRIWVDGALEVSTGHYVVAPGSSFTINCNVTKPVYPNYASIYKLVGELQTETKVSSNNNLEDAFSKVTDRYNITYADMGTTYTFHITVSDSRAVDSGNYTCGLTDEHGLIPIEINILKNIESVVFTVDDDDIAVDTQLQLDAATSKDFKCEAGVSNPQAMLRLYLGQGEDAVDVTGRLTDAQRTATPQWTQVESDVDWMWSVEYRVQLAGTLSVGGSFHNKALWCHASIPNANVTDMSSHAVTLTFSQFEPVFTGCPDIVEIGYLNEFLLECQVHAFPPVSHAYFRYVIDEDNKTSTIQPVAQSWSFVPNTESCKWARGDRFVGILYQNTSNTYMRLYAEKTRVYMYNNYTFVAENAAGRAEHVISVAEDPSDTYAQYQELNAANSPPTLLLSLVIAPLLTLSYL